MFWRCLKYALCALLITVPVACVDDDESPYARFGAFFRFQPVTAAPSTLLPALGNPGEWCTITITGSTYQFKSATGKTDSYPVTSIEQYGAPIWIGGLIVGTPTVPEIGATGFAPVCYDIVCPTCFEEGGIKRAVSITDPTLGRATCTRCRRVYDMQMGGIVIEGASTPKDPRLYRYRCHNDNDTFVVQN